MSKQLAMHSSSTAPANGIAGHHCSLDSASSATSATAMPSVQFEEEVPVPRASPPLPSAHLSLSLLHYLSRGYTPQLSTLTFSHID